MSKTSGKRGGGGTGGGDANFSTDITSTVAFGGVHIGDKFLLGSPIEDAIAKLIAAYVSPAFTSISILKTPNVMPIEVGQVLTITGANISFKLDSDGNLPNDMYLGGVGYNKAITNGNPPVNPGSTTSLSTNGTINWVLNGKDKDGVNLPSAVATWYVNFKAFLGASTTVLTAGSTALQATNLLNSLQSSQLPTNRATNYITGAWTDEEDKYTYIAYAAKLGLIANIVQNDSLPILGAFTFVGVFNYTNTFNIVEAYNIYKSNADRASSTGTKITIT